ncbi:hypothetical protein ACJJIF_02910 [Microbulbifer sp. SSSA002]|uniref:hypothetical protein n=1 Tax=Microbulbifer sp. SSSA002 TaxID=3243376 RepID=UPI004039F777
MSIDSFLLELGAASIGRVLDDRRNISIHICGNQPLAVRTKPHNLRRALMTIQTNAGYLSAFDGIKNYQTRYFAIGDDQ